MYLLSRDCLQTSHHRVQPQCLQGIHLIFPKPQKEKNLYKIMLLASNQFSPLYSHALRDPLRLMCIAVRYVALTLARTTKCLSTLHCRTSLNNFSQDMKVAGCEGVNQCSVLAVKRKFLLQVCWYFIFGKSIFLFVG